MFCRCGYRLIDCAAAYGNQKEIGEALAEVFAEGTVKRPPPISSGPFTRAPHSPRNPTPALSAAGAPFETGRA